MAGNWLSSRFWVFMDRDGVDVYVYFFALFTNDYFYIKEHFKEET